MRTATNKPASTARVRKARKDTSLAAEYAPVWGYDPAAVNQDGDLIPRWAQTLRQLLDFMGIPVEVFAERCGEVRTTMYLRRDGKRQRVTEAQFRNMELAIHPDAPIGLIQTMMPEEAIAWVRDRYPAYAGYPGGATAANSAKSPWTKGLTPGSRASSDKVLVAAA